MDVHVSVGLTYYPNGQQNVLDKRNLSQVDAFGTSLTVGLGVGLMF